MAFYRHTRNGVVANDKLMMASNSVINISVEADITLYEDIQYMQVPVADAVISHLCDLLGPRRSTHGVEMKQGRPLLLRAAFSALQPREAAATAPPSPACTEPQRLVPPNTGSGCGRGQLCPLGVQAVCQEHCALVSSPVGVIPDICEEEVHLMNNRCPSPGQR